MANENKMMLIYGSSRIFHHCACFFSSLGIESQIVPENGIAIPHYYSDKHAHDNGWRMTEDIKYCPPDQDSVWVCPGCSEKEGWIS